MNLKTVRNRYGSIIIIMHVKFAKSNRKFIHRLLDQTDLCSQQQIRWVGVHRDKMSLSLFTSESPRRISLVGHWLDLSFCCCVFSRWWTSIRSWAAAVRPFFSISCDCFFCYNHHSLLSCIIIIIIIISYSSNNIIISLMRRLTAGNQTYSCDTAWQPM